MKKQCQDVKKKKNGKRKEGRNEERKKRKAKGADFYHQACDKTEGNLRQQPRETIAQSFIVFSFHSGRGRRGSVGRGRGRKLWVGEEGGKVWVGEDGKIVSR